MHIGNRRDHYRRHYLLEPHPLKTEGNASPKDEPLSIALQLDRTICCTTSCISVLPNTNNTMGFIIIKSADRTFNRVSI